jgi:hypothetical protein
LAGVFQKCAGAYVFVPIVSEAALAPIKKVSIKDEKEDNVLLEYELAVRLQKEKRLAIFPMLVGRRDSPGSKVCPAFDFREFGGHNFPDGPSLTNPKGSVQSTICGILANQGMFFSHKNDDGTLAFVDKASQGGDCSVGDRTYKVCDVSLGC